ncbi:MAG: prepilin-type N-terminal cleavage/methylation domain-containing protein [Acidobacteria bacterium]|nr:prepilin-type N-terminal cleavage/methylation domain-containing protein [Acidobacteriota bacterium]
MDIQQREESMNKIRRQQKGFTLLEIIVVLAVIGALAAMLAPVVFRYIDDAKRTQAQSDVNTIASAIQQMYKDTGRWAFYNNGTGKLPYTSGTDASLLTSNGACTGASAAGTCDTTVPVDTSTGSTWALASGKADSLADQLILNTPFTGATGTAYSASGGRAWRGPYLDRIPALDPWARSYLVSIGNADPTTEGTNQKWVIVISAGPNGNLETLANTAGTANPVVAGDDLIARVK